MAHQTITVKLIAGGSFVVSLVGMLLSSLELISGITAVIASLAFILLVILTTIIVMALFRAHQASQVVQDSLKEISDSMKTMASHGTSINFNNTTDNRTGKTITTGDVARDVNTDMGN